MYAPGIQIDETGSWGWIAAATFAAIFLASIVFAPMAKVGVPEQAAVPHLTVPTILPPLISGASGEQA